MTEHVYMRAAKTLPTVEEQQAALRRAEAPPDFDERDRAIPACRPGDVLRVTTLAVLGATE